MSLAAWTIIGLFDLQMHTHCMEFSALTLRFLTGIPLGVILISQIGFCQHGERGKYLSYPPSQLTVGDVGSTGGVLLVEIKYCSQAMK